MNSPKYAQAEDIPGLAESLALEVAPLGLKVHCIEPGYFRTAFFQPGTLSKYESRISDYDGVTVDAHKSAVELDGRQPGDPVKLAEVIVDIARGQGAFESKEIPVTLPLGSDGWKLINGELGKTGRILNQWKGVIESTDFA
ncbi:hypothetical protein FRB94_006602 [Tulasnella sp. JGI-2019a]|nr:hypothetical protein FRB94_006602 [Tulasnella sp. JGI-2019a]KAG9000129.1 hypothetical protein FRB93_012893 [Tulasnella sp. JGI-2019a]